MGVVERTLRVHALCLASEGTAQILLDVDRLLRKCHPDWRDRVNKVVLDLLDLQQLLLERMDFYLRCHSADGPSRALHAQTRVTVDGASPADDNDGLSHDGAHDGADGAAGASAT